MAWSENLERNLCEINAYECEINEIRSVEIDILNAFVQLCEKNNLKYSLAGGTLLGAIRHSGFIPWDDDIDVLMPRPDYEKFLNLTQGTLREYSVRSIENNPQLHTRPFARVVCNDYMLELCTPPYKLPPWIDIFPMDGMPEDYEQCRVYFKKLYKIKRLIALSWQHKSDSRKPAKKGNGIKHYLKRLLMPLISLSAKIIGHHNLLMVLQNTAKKTRYETCAYVGCVVAGGHGIRERMPKSDFEAMIKVPFEGEEYCSMGCYELYLSNLYGQNYMQLPPEDERKVHVIKCWKARV